MLLIKQGNTCLLLVEVIIGKVTKEINVEVPRKAKNISIIDLPCDLAVLLLFFLFPNHSLFYLTADCSSMFITDIFTISRK